MARALGRGLLTASIRGRGYLFLMAISLRPSSQCTNAGTHDEEKQHTHGEGGGMDQPGGQRLKWTAPLPLAQISRGCKGDWKQVVHSEGGES